MQESFLAEIIANPADDALRLICADWLEEHGDEDRSEFIRVQIELSKVPSEIIAKVRCLEQEEAEGYPTLSEAYSPEDCLVQELLRRERELLDAPHNEGPFTNRAIWAKGLFREAIWSVREDVEFTRGFVSRVRLTCAAWMEYGPALVKQHPLEKIEISDKRPVALVTPAGWGWTVDFSGSEDPDTRLLMVLDPESALPILLWQTMHGNLARSDSWMYQTEIAALDALSVGCLAWAKAQ